jgi:hypothetical protein
MEAKAMKKFFIFLFSVFLITFMGCSPATGEIPETPTSETTEEPIEDATEEIPETFKVFALDDDGNSIADIDEISTDFNWVSTIKDSNGTRYLRYLYKTICINGIVFKTDNNTYLQSVDGLVYEYILSDANGQPIISDTYISFIDFYKEISNIEYSTNEIKFSDLYKRVNTIHR